MPIQRLPRYQILIDKLLKYTPPNHVDYQNLKKALAAIKTTNRAVNEKRRTTELRDKVLELSAAIHGVPNLVAAARTFIADGYSFVFFVLRLKIYIS